MREYYSLTWTWTATHDNDTVYFAHCYPYTYTVRGHRAARRPVALAKPLLTPGPASCQDLQNYLTALALDPKRSAVCRQRVLCRTLAGNVCDLLTITNFGVSQAEMARRKVGQARVFSALSVTIVRLLALP